MSVKYMNYDTIKDLSDFVKKEEEKRKKVKAACDSTATINNLRNEIIDITASNFNEIGYVKNEIKEIKGRVTALEVAADRCGRPKRGREKLSIKIHI